MNTGTWAAIVVALVVGLGAGYYFGMGQGLVPESGLEAVTDNSGGEQPDAALVVSENVQGKWQSKEDAKFTREFKSDYTAVDYYEGKEVSGGLWVAFTKMNAPEIVFPLEDNAVYLQMTLTGTQADTLTFKVVKLTQTELELVYMDRGGVLTFTRVE